MDPVGAPRRSLARVAEADAGSARAARVLVRGVGASLVVASLSLAVQIIGLVGDDGVLPARALAARVIAHDGVWSWRAPSLYWLAPSDQTLYGLVVLALVSGVLLVVGRAPVVAALAGYVAYRSLMTVGQAFLTFQWDLLMLEALVLVVFATIGGTPFGADPRAPPRAVVWLMRVLVVKLMFSSGIGKLVAGTTRGVASTRSRFTSKASRSRTRSPSCFTRFRRRSWRA